MTFLNPYGGDILTIEGFHFPIAGNEDLIDITFTDGTACEILSTTSTEVTCRVGPASDYGISVNAVVTVNGKTKEIGPILFDGPGYGFTGVYPSGCKSPDENQELVITLDTTETLNSVDYTV